MVQKLEEVEVESLDLPNIREYYDEQEIDRLGDSLIKGQQSPIIAGPLIGGRRKVFDGSRRVRAARKKSIKRLLALLVEREPTPEELVTYQLVSDIHKKHLTPHERSMAAIGIEKANPGLTIKQLSALVDMEESHFWKYLQAKKLGDDARSAYQSGTLSLTSMIEVSKLSHDDQPALLSVKGGRQEVARERKALTSNPGTPPPKAASIRVIVGGVTVTIKKKGDLSLEDAIKQLPEALKELERAKKAGHDARTLAALMKKKARA